MDWGGKVRCVLEAARLGRHADSTGATPHDRPALVTASAIAQTGSGKQIHPDIRSHPSLNGDMSSRCLEDGVQSVDAKQGFEAQPQHR